MQHIPDNDPDSFAGNTLAQAVEAFKIDFLQQLRVELGFESSVVGHAMVHTYFGHSFNTL